MWKDPIVEEVRQIRRELSAEAGNDIGEICRRLRAAEAEREANSATASPSRRGRRTSKSVTKAKAVRSAKK